MGLFKSMSIFDLLIIFTAIGLGIIIVWMLILNGNFSKKNNPTWGRYPLPRSDKFLPFNWFNGWANWKSAIYTGKKLDIEIAYIGHQVINISKDKVVIRSNCWLYAGKFLFGFILLIIFSLGFLITSKNYLKFHRTGGGCPIIIQTDAGQIVEREYFKGNIINYFYREYCYLRNALFYDNRNNTIKKKLSSLFNIDLFPLYLLFLGSGGGLLLIISRAPPPLVFNRKKRIIYTQHKGKIYISNWDKTFYTIRFIHQAFSIGFELYHLDKNGDWQSKWFSVAGHHYYGETNDYLLALKAMRADRSHAMRAWLILFMDKGAMAVHPVLPFKGILDTLTPRQTLLDEDIEAQVETLLKSLDYKAPGEAEPANRPDPEIQQLLRQNNDLDLYDILTEKNLAKYIADRDAKAAKQS
ncbi:MAG: hypothetical protein OFPII_12430 [Osedax symbiont Rs1]|nr:MAG: hypothetical protein OFPII_12430 [Osedax symbiont Rs1]